MSKESLEVMVARIDENVIQLRKDTTDTRDALNEHIEEDKKIVREFLRPLWEDKQQAIGAYKARTLGAVVLDKAVTIGVAAAAAYAALRGIPK